MSYVVGFKSNDCCFYKERRIWIYSDTDIHRGKKRQKLEWCSYKPKNASAARPPDAKKRECSIILLWCRELQAFLKPCWAGVGFSRTDWKGRLWVTLPVEISMRMCPWPGEIQRRPSCEVTPEHSGEIWKSLHIDCGFQKKPVA